MGSNPSASTLRMETGSFPQDRESEREASSVYGNPTVHTISTPGAIVYWLGHQALNLESGVQFPVAPRTGDRPRLS